MSTILCTSSLSSKILLSLLSQGHFFCYYYSVTYFFYNIDIRKRLFSPHKLQPLSPTAVFGYLRLKKGGEMKNHSKAPFPTACNSFEDDSCSPGVTNQFVSVLRFPSTNPIKCLKTLPCLPSGVCDGLHSSSCADCASLRWNYQTLHCHRKGRPVNSSRTVPTQEGGSRVK